MGKIIYLPLEHIESRYTVHMDRDITKYLKNIEYMIERPEYSEKSKYGKSAI